MTFHQTSLKFSSVVLGTVTAKKRIVREIESKLVDGDIARNVYTRDFFRL